MTTVKRKTTNINSIQFDMKIFEQFKKRNRNTKNFNYKAYH